MPQIMSDLDHSDALAAEYVLGTLDSDERAQARALLAADDGFAAKVRFWERHLGELHLMVEPVEPEPKIWVRIKARMLEAQPAPVVEAPPPQDVEAASAPEATPAPSLDAIEAVISETATVLNADARPPQLPETGPAANAVAIATGEDSPAPIAEATLAPAAEPTVPPAPPAPPGAAFDPAAPPTSEEVPLPAPELPPAPALELPPASALELPPAPLPELPPAANIAEPVETAPAAPPPPPIPAEVPSEERRTPLVAPLAKAMVIHRRLRRWRAFALLLALLVLAVAALLAAWRFEPDRVPPALRPLELMRQLGVALPASPPPRRPLPPQSQFDE
jgi:anti-sigma-K factor RskA